MRKSLHAFLVIYMLAGVLAGFVGAYDPPGQTGCDVTWCGMIGFLAVFALGLPWTFFLIRLTGWFGDVGMYWVCWGAVALNLGLLLAFARAAKHPVSAE